MNKEACIIATGEWNNSRVLFKNRDRNYIPPIKVYHEIHNGVEILYYRDELTGWTEGINEFGIGIVNAALAVKDDEKAKLRILEKKKKTVNGERTVHPDKDPIKMMNALQCDNVDDAISILCEDSGFLGHTFVSDGFVTKAIELTSEHECIVRTLRNSGVHVRTNHGIYHETAGYQDGIKRDSSVSRRNRAIRKLREVKNVEEIAPAIYGYRVGKDPLDPLNMVRDSKNQVDMKTTSQVVYDLSNRKMYLYLIPRKVRFLGYQKDPKIKKPKCSVSIIKYTGIREDGTFDMDVIDTNEYGIKEYTRPTAKLASVKTAMLKRDIVKGLNPDVKKKPRF